MLCLLRSRKRAGVRVQAARASAILPQAIAAMTTLAEAIKILDQDILGT